MPFTNLTSITEFIIFGFPGLHPWYYGLVGALFFLVYLAILAGNTFILVVVASERKLQKPTYLIFCNLAVSDIAFATTTLPKAISRYWLNDQIISFAACFLQMYLVHFLGSVNSFLLLIMALDRYVAICNPLRYPSLIKTSTTFILCGASWLIAMLIMIVIVIQALYLPYCGPNVITQCYCDHYGITRLACDKGREVQYVTLGLAMSVLLGPLTFVVFSYISIIASVMKIASKESRYKAFSTCTPQLLIICLYYLPRCFNYLAGFVGFAFSADVRIVIIMLYSLFPPAVNPLIYCFRTKEIKENLIRQFYSKKAMIGHS